MGFLQGFLKSLYTADSEAMPIRK